MNILFKSYKLNILYYIHSVGQTNKLTNKAAYIYKERCNKHSDNRYNFKIIIRCNINDKR